MRWISALTAALLVAPAAAQTSGSGPRVGDTYEITREVLSREQSDDNSSGTSTDRDSIIERVIGVREGGLELEYDFPPGTSDGEKASTWQLPVRVFKPDQGPMQLLNRSELEARVEPWLRKAGWTRAICGHWIFTWNAFQIDCDPETAIAIVEAYDLSVAGLREGALYRDRFALEPVPLARRSKGSNGAIFTAELKVDPDLVRSDHARSDVAVGEITGKPTTLEAALRAHSTDTVSGTIAVTLETDGAGRVRQRTRIVRMESRTAGGPTETRTVRETVKRRPVSRRIGGGSASR